MRVMCVCVRERERKPPCCPKMLPFGRRHMLLTRYGAKFVFSAVVKLWWRLMQLRGPRSRSVLSFSLAHSEHSVDTSFFIQTGNLFTREPTQVLVLHEMMSICGMSTHSEKDPRKVGVLIGAAAVHLFSTEGPNPWHLPSLHLAVKVESSPVVLGHRLKKETAGILRQFGRNHTKTAMLVQVHVT